MEQTTIALKAAKNVALIAHDHKKPHLLAWVKAHREALSHGKLYATGTTGLMLTEKTGLEITRFNSGPLGGDQQIGAKIVEGDIDLLIFFWDPLQPQPHDPDVKALLRLAVVWNIPMACNQSTADFLVSSPWMSAEYQREVPDYSDHAKRLKEDT